MKWSPGCTCCDRPETCTSVAAFFTELGSPYDLDPRWLKISGSATLLSAGFNKLDVFAVSGTTVIRPTYFDSLYNEAFGFQFKAREGASGTAATVTLIIGGNQLIVDLQGDTMQLNGGTVKSISAGADDTNNDTFITMLVNPDFVTAFVQRLGNVAAAESYEHGLSNAYLTAFDIDTTPAAYDAGDISIEVTSRVVLSAASYLPLSVKWDLGDAEPEINCGCSIFNILLHSRTIQFYEQISKLNIGITGAQYPPHSLVTVPLPSAVSSERWGSGGGGRTFYNPFAAPGDYWGGDANSIIASRGYWIENANLPPGNYYWSESGNDPTDQFVSSGARLTCTLESLLTCGIPTAGDPYPLPVQTITLTGRKFDQSTAFFYGCDVTATNTLTRDITDFASSFSLAVVLPAVPGCPRTWMQTSTTLTANWPGV